MVRAARAPRIGRIQFDLRGPLGGIAFQARADGVHQVTSRGRIHRIARGDARVAGAVGERREHRVDVVCETFEQHIVLPVLLRAQQECAVAPRPEKFFGAASADECRERLIKRHIALREERIVQQLVNDRIHQRHRIRLHGGAHQRVVKPA